MNDYCFALESYPKCSSYEQLRDFLVLPSKRKLQYITSSVDKDQVLNKDEYKMYLHGIAHWGTGACTDEDYDTLGWLSQCRGIGEDPSVGIPWQAFEDTLYGKLRKGKSTSDLASVRQHEGAPAEVPAIDGYGRINGSPATGTWLFGVEISAMFDTGLGVWNASRPLKALPIGCVFPFIAS